MVKRVLIFGSGFFLRNLTESCRECGILIQSCKKPEDAPYASDFGMIIASCSIFLKYPEYFERLRKNSAVVVVASINRKKAVLEFIQCYDELLISPVNSIEILRLYERCVVNRHIQKTRNEITRDISRALEYIDDAGREFDNRIQSISNLASFRNVVDPVYIFEEFIKTVILLVTETLDCTRCSVYVLDRGGQDLVIIARKLGGKIILDEKKIEVRGEITRYVQKNKKALVIKDIHKDRRFVTSVKSDYRTKSFLSAPVIYQNEVVAIFNAADKQNQAEFNENDLSRISEITAKVADVVKTGHREFQAIVRQGIKKSRSEITAHFDSNVEKLSLKLENTRHQLKKKLQEIQTIRNISKVIKTTFVIEELLRMVVDTVAAIMKCRRCSVLLIDELRGDLMVKGVIGKNGRKVENLRIEKRGFVTDFILKTKKSVLYPKYPKEIREYVKNHRSLYETDDFLCVPVIVKEKVAAIINATDKISDEALSMDDMNMLEIIADQTAVSMENFRLSEELVEKERITKELEIAHTIQSKLMPCTNPEMAGLDIAARNIPAKEVGGDYYDFFEFTPEHLGIIIGDVSGKGVPAALFMVMVRSFLKPLLDMEKLPSDIMNELNVQVLDDIQTYMFVTLCYCFLDMREKRIFFSNAGHNYPFILRKNNEICFMNSEDIVLGMFEHYEYNSLSETVENGDIIVFYTDGITEAESKERDDTMYETERLIECVKKNRMCSAEEIMNRIINEVEVFSGSALHNDDITLIIIKVK